MSYTKVMSMDQIWSTSSRVAVPLISTCGRNVVAAFVVAEIDAVDGSPDHQASAS
jgi:hypothetical protein